MLLTPACYLTVRRQGTENSEASVPQHGPGKGSWSPLRAGRRPFSLRLRNPWQPVRPHQEASATQTAFKQVSLHVFTHIPNTHAHTHVHTSVHTLPHSHVCMCTYTSPTQVCIPNMLTHLHMHSYMHMSAHINMHVCVCLCMHYTRMHTHVCTSTYTFI